MTSTVDIQVQNSSLVGKYAQIITRGRVVGGGAIWYRARIIHETSVALTVSYYKTNHETHKQDLHTEMIKKIDIVSMRLYVD